MVFLFLAHGADPTPLPWDELLANIIKFTVTIGMVIAFAGQILAPLFKDADEKRKQQLVGWVAMAALLVLGMGWWLTRQTLTEAVAEDPRNAKHAEHANRSGGQVVMWGDYHAEVSRLVSGEFRLHLTDAYARPIGNQHFKAEIATKSGEEVDEYEKMIRSLDGDYYFARYPKEVKEVQVKVVVPGWWVKLDFSFDEQNGRRSLPLWCGTAKR